MKVLILLSMLLLSSCTFDVDQPEYGPDDSLSSIVYIEIDNGCYDVPYWEDPEWCDLYGDGECCTWYIDGWFEEWCDWGYMDCWEYYDSY